MLGTKRDRSPGQCWRDIVIAVAGPSILPGVRAGDWLRVLWENRFAVHPRYALRAASITLFSLVNSPVSWYEKVRYRRELDGTRVSSPLFILGHWRSGTTFLHNLITIDSRFAYPTLCDVLFPNTFLVMQPLLSRLLGPLVPEKRPSDRLRFGLDVSHEDELAICVGTFLSAHMSMVFPHWQEHYDRYVTLRNVPAAQILCWRAAWLAFLTRLTFRNGDRTLVLKSPEHTGRIRLILEMFPDAKFVHIHRNPYHVFRSTRHTMEESCRRQCLQRREGQSFDERVLSQYEKLYAAFFEDRPTIPPGRFCEVSFEELERDPVPHVRRIYEQLDLPAFSQTEQAVRRYALSLRGYRKNQYDELPTDLKRQIAARWRRCFDEWGYSR